MQQPGRGIHPGVAREIPIGIPGFGLAFCVKIAQEVPVTMVIENYFQGLTGKQKQMGSKIAGIRGLSIGFAANARKVLWLQGFSGFC
jgi:hypothetical protein